MTMLEKQKELANIYKYKPLPPLLSFMQRQEYEDNLPDEFRNYKQNTPIYSKSGILICNKLVSRIYVCGDYGIFLEANREDMVLCNLKVKEGQEYRIHDKRYSENIKYYWYSPITGNDVKIYYQQKTVEYADYLVGKYYFSPYEVTTIKDIKQDTT